VYVFDSAVAVGDSTLDPSSGRTVDLHGYSLAVAKVSSRSKAVRWLNAVLAALSSVDSFVLTSAQWQLLCRFSLLCMRAALAPLCQRWRMS
jgi:hypothetical protein